MYGLCLLVVAGAGHVGHERGQRLHLPHELVADARVVVVHVVCEVTHVDDQVEVPALRLVLQVRQRLQPKSQ